MGTTISRCVEPGPVFSLFQAVRQGDVRTIKFRLDLDPELLTYRNLGDRDTVWHVAAAGASEDVLAALAAHTEQLPPGLFQAAINARNDKGQTPLMHAAARGHAAAVKWLLDKGADVWLQDRCGKRSALHYAAMRGRLDCITALLDSLPSTQDVYRYIDLRSISGLTPLHYAVAMRQADAARLLLERGADLLAVNTAGDAYDLINIPARSTALHVAALQNHLDTAMALLQFYHMQLAGPNFQDPRRRVNALGRPPYRVALARGNGGLLAELLHPSSNLEALFARNGGDSRPAVPRLAAIASAAVRRQLVEDIAHAEKVILGFRRRHPCGSPTCMLRCQTRPFLTPFEQSKPVDEGPEEATEGVEHWETWPDFVPGQTSPCPRPPQAPPPHAQQTKGQRQVQVQPEGSAGTSQGADAGSGGVSARVTVPHEEQSACPGGQGPSACGPGPRHISCGAPGQPLPPPRPRPRPRQQQQSGCCGASQAQGQQAQLQQPQQQQLQPREREREGEQEPKQQSHLRRGSYDRGQAQGDVLSLPAQALRLRRFSREQPAAALLLPPLRQTPPQPPPPQPPTDDPAGPHAPTAFVGDSGGRMVAAAAPEPSDLGNCCAVRKPSPFVRRSAGYVETMFSRAPLLPVTQCAVCLEDSYCLVSEPCHHRLCANCGRDVTLRAATMPLPCPVCRLGVHQFTSPVC